MPFMQIGALAVPIAINAGSVRAPERIGSSMRMFDGGLRTAVRKEKRSWQATTKMLTANQARDIEDAVRNGVFVTVYGDGLDALRSSADLVTAYTAGDDLAALGAVTSRASTATYVDSSGIVRTAASGVMRDAHYINGVRYLLLELSATNHCRSSEDVSNATYWTSVGTPTVTVNTHTAPDGTLTADTIDDSSAVETRGRRQTLTGLTNDSNRWIWSCFVRKRKRPHATGYVLLNLRLQPPGGGGSTVDAYAVFDIYNGTKVQNGAAAHSTIESVGDYWRISVAANNNSTGNTELLASVYPGGTDTLTASTAVAGQGIEVFWGYQIEGGIVATGGVPTSYIPTTTASVTRALDSLYFPFPVTQEMTVYWKGIDIGNYLLGSARFWQMSNAGNTAPRLILLHSSPFAQLLHDNGTTSVTAGPSIHNVQHDVQELRALFAATGAVQVGRSINGATETVSSQSAALAPQVTWNDRWYLAGQNTGIVAVRRVVAAPGTRTMDEMRSNPPITCEATLGDSPFTQTASGYRRALNITLREV